MRHSAARCLSTTTAQLSTAKKANQLPKGDAYQFVHRSEIPSYHFQKSLRRLPIPKLEETCKRYLASAEAVLEQDDVKRLKSLVSDFQAKEGPELQTELLAYDKRNAQTSYISETWFDMYLRARVPCPVNYNPFMMYAPDPDPKFNHQLTRATNLAISYGRIKRALDANVLAPEVFHLVPKNADNQWYKLVCKSLPESVSWFGAVAFKAFPLDMSQYKSLFNGTRIPRAEKDVLFNDPAQKHFVAQRRGRFYSIRLFDESGNLLQPGDVHAQLAAVLSDDRPIDASSSIGSLTSLDRSKWAEVRARLESDAQSAAALKKIDGSLFVLCLDDLNSTDHRRLVQSLLIGDDAANRWFDKCFQLIVDANGQATINFEHSWGDGVAVLRLMEESHKDATKNHFVSPDDKPAAVKTDEIVFNVQDWLRQEIKSAQKQHQVNTADLDFATVQYPAMNRKILKKAKISPDSIMQLAIQFAYYNAYKKFVPTYESSSTAAFLKGRTEVLRSATSATRAAVLSLSKGETGDSVHNQIYEAAKIHSQLAKEAAMGAGFDRHLLGLRITAERLGRPIPALFNDRAHQYLNHFVLSTSTLSTETIVFGGFGPVVPDGFGIGYNVVDSLMGGVISSYRSQNSAEQFAKSLENALDQIRRVVVKN